MPDLLLPDGGRLRYEVTGRGVPLALIHGLAFDMRAWDQQVDAFAARHLVVRYDLRGHGASSLPTSRGAGAHADDLKALLDHLGLGVAVLVGHSLGGFIALEFALRHPRLTQALVLIDPGLGGFRWSGVVADWMARTWRAAREESVERAREVWLGGAPFASAMAREDSRQAMVDMVRSYSGWDWVTDVSVSPPPRSQIERLSEILAPTAVLIGTLNEADYHEVGAILERGLPHAHRSSLDGVAHVPSLEDPDGLARAVLASVAMVIETKGSRRSR